MFTKVKQSGLLLWNGVPDCDAAHNQLLDALKANGAPFLPAGTPLNDRRKGNLGEFIAHTIGMGEFLNCKAIVANADNPLSDISRSDLDLLWLFFGKSAQDDFGIVQEVKTTGDNGLGYANSLIADYAKLFQTDPACNLQARFGVAANKLAGLRFSPDVCARTRRLGGIDAATSPQVRLCPTLVHEKNGATPVPKMLAVRNTIIGAGGWNGQAVDCWSVSIENIESRLASLSWGQ